jgi:glycosyltransferase involved in cell wall biosynthesis
VLKIALVAQNISPFGSPPGPAASAQADRMSAVAKAMSRQGHRVTIFGRMDSPRRSARGILAPGVTVEHLPAGPAAELAPESAADHIPEFAGRLAERWRHATPDVAYAYYWTSGLSALAGGRDLHVPVVQTFGSLGSAEQRHPAAKSVSAGRIRLETTIARAVSTVLASSSDEATELLRLGVPRNSIRVVPVGVDTTVFTDQGKVSRRSSRPRLITISEINEKQGLATAIKALAHVRGAELIVAGGPARDDLDADPDYQALAKLAAAIGVLDRVIFIGQVTATQLAAWLRSADLAVAAACYDPFGLAAIRAMACGLPVVASAVGGNSDAVVDGTTGALVQPGQPDTLAREIRALLASPARLAAFGVAGADRAKVRYSWDRIARETLAAGRVGGHAEPMAEPVHDGDPEWDELLAPELATA